MANGSGNNFGSNEGLKKVYPGVLTYYNLIVCIVAAMGGLTFGYDVGISGKLQSLFSSVHGDGKGRTVQYCNLERQVLTWFTSSLYIGAVVSALLASTATRKLGRKFSMFLGSMLFCVGWLIKAFAKNAIIGRMLLGFGIGFTNQAVPLYISEISHYKYRGGLTIGFQLFVTLGISGANLMNYFIANCGTRAWRLSIFCGVILFAMIISVETLVLPETPSSLLECGRFVEAKRNLKKIRGLGNVDDEFNDMVAASEAARHVTNHWRELLFKRKYRPQLIMAIVIPFFQQLTGSNAILFFLATWFNTFAFGHNVALVSTVITSGVLVLATGIAIYGVDKWGRRFLFIQGGIQMFICQIVVTIFMAMKFGVDENHKKLPVWYNFVVVLFMCMYMVAFSWSWGPLGWLVPSEIFPLEIRSAAQSLSICVYMVSMYLVAHLSLIMLCHLKFGIFLFYGFFVLVMTTVVFLLLPETKTIPIEEMIVIWKEHWFWARFIDED